MARGTALITGASMGLGAELARLFAADGHDLVLVARSLAKLEALATELSGAHGVSVRVEVRDLADAAAIAALAADLADTPVEFLVNNAGFGTNGRFIELDPAPELGQIAVNVAALADLTRRFLPAMVRRGSGRVLNIASTAGFQPGPFMATYYATKAFVLSFSQALAVEVAGSGVTVTAHCPGPTATGFQATAGMGKVRLGKGGADATACARHAYRAMHGGRRVAIHGPLNAIMAWLARVSPMAMTLRVAAYLNRGPS